MFCIFNFSMNSARCYSSGRAIRVRFAPSPTGDLHIGGLRTALFNYLYARRDNGKFILRIEDTDRQRTIPLSSEKIVTDLKWCGIIPDEGPTFGGDYGPYIQSHRKELYREFVDKLLDKGAAYYCFCSEKRLDLLRRDAQRKNMVPKYDNKCRSLTTKEVTAKLLSNVDKCVRFKLINSKPFNDIVYGKVLHEVEAIEGDPVILKKDGWPTYHLANVVDDHTMNISHVIRGVEWLQSTNKHLMIYSALGCNPPQFAHLPLLLNADGTKFSKRQKDLSLESLRNRGILSKSLINIICYTSSGFENCRTSIKIHSLEELVGKFDLGNVGKASGRLPLDRLEEFNRLELTRLVNCPREIVALVHNVRQIVMETFSKNECELDLRDEHIKTILLWSVPRITYLKDLVKKDLEFLWITPKRHSLQTKDIALLSQLKDELRHESFDDKVSINEFLRKYSGTNSIQFKELMKLLRDVISGLQSGPGVAEMLTILGKEISLARIERAIRESSLLKETV